jgi:predicted TPR repeat methyltransferase
MQCCREAVKFATRDQKTQMQSKFEPCMANKLDFGPTLHNEQIREMDRHTQCSKANMARHYSELAANYDCLITRVGYTDPALIADLATKVASTKGFKPESSRVIDFGCGTGLVAQSL